MTTPNFEIITLCGSTKFKEDFLRIARKKTLEGKLVFSVGVFKHADNEFITKIQESMLRSIHFQKINMSSEIFVINKNGYIGESTREEIQYAKEMGIKISYMEKPNENMEETDNQNKSILNEPGIYLCVIKEVNGDNVTVAFSGNKFSIETITYYFFDYHCIDFLSNEIDGKYPEYDVNGIANIGKIKRKYNIVITASIELWEKFTSEYKLYELIRNIYKFKEVKDKEKQNGENNKTDGMER